MPPAVEDASHGDEAPDAQAETIALVVDRMPDFTRPVRLGRHVLDTALSELRSRGINDERVRIHPVSSGGQQGTVVGQTPAAGSVIDKRDSVHLFVEQTALMDRLPYALRDEDPAAFGTDQILGLFDSPAAHVGHYLRLGGDLFALREGDERGARRWLDEVFAIDPSLFDRSRWYRIVRFAARLHELAGRPDAALVALRVVYGIEGSVVCLAPAVTSRVDTAIATLSGSNNQLGFSTILGGEPSTKRRLTLRLGPVSLAQFEAHRDIGMRRERMSLYRLCVPHWIDANVIEQWWVAGAADGMRLDTVSREAPRLGWTSYLTSFAQAQQVEMARG